MSLESLQNAVPAAAALTVRLGCPEELFRLAPLMASTSELPPKEAKWLLAFKQKPVERIAAALAWWPEGPLVKFLIVRQPGIPAKEAAGCLVPVMESMPDCGGVALEYARMLSEKDDLAPWLAGHGYKPLRGEKVLETPSAAVYERVGSFLARYGSEIPSTWRTEPISQHTPETVWPLIEPYGLIKFEALKRFWSRTGERGYNPDMSNILFDGSTPLGTLLVRTNRVCLAIDIRAVKQIQPRLRALANVVLFGHIQRAATPASWSVIAFRGDMDEHRETLNLAGRMGGREVDVRYSYTRPLNSSSF